MRILLIEDNDTKAAAVTSALNTIGSSSHQVTRAKNFIDGTRRLAQEAYDLLLLDVMLPVRELEQASIDGARMILSEILSDNGGYRPSHIICLTAYDDCLNLFDDVKIKSLVHVLKYEETGGIWKEALSSKINYIEKRLLQTADKPISFQCDIALIASAPDVELDQILKLPGFTTGEFNQDDGLYYYCASWPMTEGPPLKVVSCAAPTMGMPAACVTALKMINRCRPRFIVMTGIAAGTSKELNFGDILVAEAVFDYGSGKIKEDNKNQRMFIPNPRQLDIDPGLHAILQRCAREQKYMKEIQFAWKGKDQTLPRLVIGHIASGAAVVQSASLVDQILSSARKVVGLDMEAYGIASVAHYCSRPRPKFLIAKSVSDFADSDKKDDYQEYAAFTSSRFIYEFFLNSDANKLLD